jgi:hypothetical protein
MKSTMRKVLLVLAISAYAVSSNAQDKPTLSNKNINSKNKVAKMDYSRTQPKKVDEAFLKDYPEAQNVVWSKYKGNHTASFTNAGVKSTAMYLSNGERRDTRTPITRPQLPGEATTWDEVFKRDNVEPRAFIQIERPTETAKLYRVIGADKSVAFYNETGVKVEYDY